MDKERTVILPNFLIIGSGRCGTSFLYECLLQHPDIFLKSSKRPEPHFFLKESDYRNGLEYYSDQYFSEWKGEKAIGEASVNYLFFETAARRVKKHFPEMKLICLVRNPIDRIYSAYCRSVQTGWEDLSFEDALKNEDERTQNPPDEFHRVFQPKHYTKRGFYKQHIDFWLKYFDLKHLLALTYDDLIKDTDKVLRQIFQLLGVDKNEQIVIPEQKINSSSRSKKPMSKRIRKQLVDLYHNPNLELANFLGKNLDHWNQYE